MTEASPRVGEARVRDGSSAEPGDLDAAALPYDHASARAESAVGIISRGVGTSHSEPALLAACNRYVPRDRRSRPPGMRPDTVPRFSGGEPVTTDGL
jgi:hypothetical protein